MGQDDSARLVAVLVEAEQVTKRDRGAVPFKALEDLEGLAYLLRDARNDASVTPPSTGRP